MSKEPSNLLSDSPSLRVELRTNVQDAYLEARGDAADAMNVDISVFAVRCPWTAEQILNLEWLP